MKAGGSFYVLGTDSLSARLAMYKADSDDPSDGWTEVDGSGAPTEVIGGVYTCILDGTTIHAAQNGLSDGQYSYHSFNTGDDTWTDIDVEIEAATDPNLNWISIAVRSDGTIVVCYNGETDSEMGNDKERVDLNIGSSASPPVWGGPVSLNAGGDVHYGNPNCVLGTNDGVHFMWQRQVFTGNDPPTSWAGTGRARTLDSGDNLSTVVAGGMGTDSALLGAAHSLSYDDSGTQRIITVGSDAGGSEGREFRLSTEDGNDDVQAGSFASSTVTESYINGEVGIVTIGELNTDLHTLFSGGGTVGVDQDLYYSKSTDDGVTWTTPVEEIDAITVNFISGTIYVRGSDTVFAYVYDDGGVQKYNEKILIAGAGLDFLPLFSREKRPNVLLRM